MSLASVQVTSEDEDDIAAGVYLTRRVFRQPEDSVLSPNAQVAVDRRTFAFKRHEAAEAITVRHRVVDLSGNGETYRVERIVPERNRIVVECSA